MQSAKKNHVSKGTGTLKLSARNVMLYRSEYDRESRATRQTYVAGFSRSATAIPPAFVTALKHLVREPDRRQQMLARIEADALVPARQRAVHAVERQARLAALAPLAEARRAIGRAARCVDSQKQNPELANEMVKLQDAFALMSEAAPTRTNDGEMDAAIASLESACAGLIRAVQALPKRAALNAGTVNRWQRAWYSYQDMLAGATSRAALRRPAGWSHPSVRAAVAQGQDANQAAALRRRSAPSGDVG